MECSEKFLELLLMFALSIQRCKFSILSLSRTRTRTHSLIKSPRHFSVQGSAAAPPAAPPELPYRLRMRLQARHDAHCNGDATARFDDDEGRDCVDLLDSSSDSSDEGPVVFRNMRRSARAAWK